MIGFLIALIALSSLGIYSSFYPFTRPDLNSIFWPFYTVFMLVGHVLGVMLIIFELKLTLLTL